MIEDGNPNLYKRSIRNIVLGLMGSPMARQLHKVGAKLHIWNRNNQTAIDLANKLGETIVCKTPSEVAINSDVTIVMVTDAKAVDAVVFGKNGAAEGCDKNSLLIDMGTTSVIQTREFSERLRGSWVDAPVSGGTTAAENGTLTIMAGGPKEAFSRALPLLQVMGEHITHVGKTGAGQVAKSANQMIVGLTIAAVAEAFALARHNGVEPTQIRKALFGGFAHSRVLELHGKRMINKDFTPRAKCSIQRKDMAEALTLARSVNLTLPSLTANMKLWDHMVNNDMADLDHSALLLAIDPILK